MSMIVPANTTKPNRCVGGKSESMKMAKPAAMMTWCVPVCRQNTACGFSASLRLPDRAIEFEHALTPPQPFRVELRRTRHRRVCCGNTACSVCQ